MLLTNKNPLKTPYASGGFSFMVDMSFNVILTVFEVLDDNEIDNLNKVLLILYLLTGDEMFDDAAAIKTKEEAEQVQQLLNDIFDDLIISDKLKDNIPTDLLGNKLPIKQGKKTYDFAYDAEYIYASFMQAYHIDLFEQQGKLHWHKFIALFNGLPSETIMMKIIDVRERDIPTGKGSKDSARQLREAKARYALPNTQKEEGE